MSGAVFKISRKADYAVRVMVSLASGPPHGRVSTSDLQERTLVPLAFLQRIVANLRRGGLLKTYPGVAGGLALARSPDAITILDVYTAIEGPIRLSECIREPEGCPLSGPCAVRPRWAALEAAITGHMAGTTLKQLAQETAQAEAKLRRRRGAPASTSRT